MKTKIIFTEKAKPFILEALGNIIDKNGFVVNSKTNEFTLDADGKKFKAKKFIGVIKKKYLTNIFQAFDLV